MAKFPRGKSYFWAKFLALKLLANGGEIIGVEISRSEATGHEIITLELSITLSLVSFKTKIGKSVAFLGSSYANLLHHVHCTPQMNKRL